MNDGLTEQGLAQFTEDVWLASEPVRIVGMKLAATMTVVRLPGSGLLLHSPVAMTNERRKRVESLGTVTHLYAPNTFHHVWMGEWARAFPGACLHAPAAIRKKRPDLRVDRAHDVEPLGELGASFDEVHIAGLALEETVLVHRPSRTLIVADLVHNVGRPADRWTAVYTKAMGFYDRVAISRMLRWTAFTHVVDARESLDRLASLDFGRMVVGHGTPCEHHAREALLGAYEWMRKPRRRLFPGPSTSRRGYCG